MKCNNSYEKHRKKRNKNCLQPERVPGIINVRPDTSDTAQGPHSSRNWRQFYYKAIWRILQCLQKKKPRSCPPWQIRGFYAWRQRDSNPRPLRCERNALPAELCPRFYCWTFVSHNKYYSTEIGKCKEIVAKNDKIITVQTFLQNQLLADLSAPEAGFRWIPEVLSPSPIDLL